MREEKGKLEWKNNENEIGINYNPSTSLSSADSHFSTAPTRSGSLACFWGKVDVRVRKAHCRHSSSNVSASTQ